MNEGCQVKMSTWTHLGSAHFHTRMILREMMGLKIMCKMMGLVCRMMGLVCRMMAGDMALLTLKRVKNWLMSLALEKQLMFVGSRHLDKSPWVWQMCSSKNRQIFFLLFYCNMQNITERRVTSRGRNVWKKKCVILSQKVIILTICLKCFQMNSEGKHLWAGLWY